ncbi:hypothetical protein [Skermania piniformis]|uniref:Uncharacterized protein n=1 Tax=Skermania pinensis TaxID=39122 RepID=A0ABX8SAW0_9ACTN|nr:hypothetical protein [Skermania piniformis]QXQ14923.1 hypothetical protein KV203_05990 [Skermania piniformis]
MTEIVAAVVTPRDWAHRCTTSATTVTTAGTATTHAGSGRARIVMFTLIDPVPPIPTEPGRFADDYFDPSPLTHYARAS